MPRQAASFLREISKCGLGYGSHWNAEARDTDAVSSAAHKLRSAARPSDKKRRSIAWSQKRLEMVSLLMNRNVRKTLRDATHVALRSVCAFVCTACVFVASATSRAEPRSSPGASQGYSTSTARSIEPAAPETAGFRLGNASRPFGWSTVIGDFNTDGKPDVAVADHLGRDPIGYEYRIEVSLSGDAPDDLTFESSHDAVTIRASDVDRDHDLDIIVGLPFSRETVGVWLNDGHGHFTVADVGKFPAALEAQETVGTADLLAHVAPVNLSPRRTHDGLPRFFQGEPSISRHRVVFSTGHNRSSSSASLRISPRAPPAHSSDFSS